MRFLTCFLVASLLASCGDSTGPDEKRLDLDVSRTREQLAAAGEPPGASCDFQIEARAHEQITWRSSTLYFEFGPDAEAIDSIVVSASDLGGLFGSPLPAGEDAVATLSVSAAFPFRLRGEIRFTGGRHATTEFRSTCGPIYEPDGAPTITSFEVIPDTLEMGQWFQIEYSVSSDVPLWGTWIVMSGGHNEIVGIGEGLATSASRTVDIKLRYDPETIGMPVDISIQSYDAALRFDADRTITPPLTFTLSAPN